MHIMIRGSSVRLPHKALLFFAKCFRLDLPHSAPSPLYSPVHNVSMYWFEALVVEEVEKAHITRKAHVKTSKPCLISLFFGVGGAGVRYMTSVHSEKKEYMYSTYKNSHITLRA